MRNALELGSDQSQEADQKPNAADDGNDANVFGEVFQVPHEASRSDTGVIGADELGRNEHQRSRGEGANDHGRGDQVDVEVIAKREDEERWGGWYRAVEEAESAELAGLVGVLASVQQRHRLPDEQGQNEELDDDENPWHD